MSRRRRFRRSDDPPQLRLTPRDHKIIECIAQNRLLTRSQIQREFFGSDSTANFRLQKLWQHGYIDRPERQNQGGVTQDTLYTVTQRGLQLIEFATGAKPSRKTPSSANPNQIEHDLALADIRLQLERSARATGLTLTWQGEDAMRKKPFRVFVQSKTRSLVPDAYAVVEEGRTVYRFFVEYDRGSEAPIRVQDKLGMYDRFILSSEYMQRLETTHPARVLFVAREPAKIKAFQTNALKLRNPHYYHFASLADFLAQDPLHANIWSVSGRPASAILAMSKVPGS